MQRVDFVVDAVEPFVDSSVECGEEMDYSSWEGSDL